MARYQKLYLGDELIKLRDGLEVLERVVEFDALKELNVHLYGIITDETILDAAKEAISDEYMVDEGQPTIGESDVQLSEIAIAIPIANSDVIDILHRGFPLRDLSFEYQSEGEGARTGYFNDSHSAYNTTVKVDQMTEQAIAPDKTELAEFLQAEGTGKVMQVKRRIQRDEEATVNAPHVSEPLKPETPEAGIPKQTSLSILDIVEKFLG